MLRIIAIIFGIAFIFVGVAGFLSTFVKNGLLFGIFEMGSLHSIAFIVTGVLAIMCATRFKSTKLYFKIVGIVYAIVAIVGFWRGGDLYILHVNLADNVLHIVIGVIAIYLGFAAKTKEAV